MENWRSFYAQAGCGFTCCTELPVVGSRVGAVPPQGPFPTPATSNGACGFPALRFLADFTPRSATVVMWWPGIGSWRRTRSARAARHRSTHVVESGAASRTGEAQAGPDRTQCRRQPPDGRRRFRLNSGIDSLATAPYARERRGWVVVDTARHRCCARASRRLVEEALMPGITFTVNGTRREV